MKVLEKGDRFEVLSLDIMDELCMGPLGLRVGSIGTVVRQESFRCCLVKFDNIGRTWMMGYSQLRKIDRKTNLLKTPLHKEIRL